MSAKASQSAGGIRKSEVTLQINLCAGDVAYMAQTVPAIVATHRSDVAEVVAVVDECRPPSTPFLHAPSRYPRPAFRRAIADLRGQCADLQRGGWIDRVVTLGSDPRSVRRVNRRYLGLPSSRTHDHLGHASVAYYIGWDSCATRYVLHSDADVLFHQAAGHSWVRAAVAALQADATLLAVSPRIAPPDESLGVSHMVEVGREGSGWSESWPAHPTPEGWRSPWFSTRCHLLDRERLEDLIPFVPRGGRPRVALAAMVDAILAPAYRWTPWVRAGGSQSGRRRSLDRIGRRVVPPFPLPPEVLVHDSAPRAHLQCLYLRDRRAWILHPNRKGADFVSLLPRLLPAVTAGRVPDRQRGVGEVALDAWADFVR